MSIVTASTVTAPIDQTPRIPNVVFVTLSDELWRVTRADGEVLGYVDRFRVREGLRYRAKLFAARAQRYITMGEFWSMDDAAQCFRAN